MKEEIPLIYEEWDEAAGQSKGPVAQVLVDQGVLFLRKLVNATVIRNRIYEHTSNESDGEESFIYLQPFEASSCDAGEAVERALLARHDVAVRYEAEYWIEENHRFSCREILKFEHSWDAAQLLLDHYIHFRGKHCEVIYAVLDPARRKLLLFLRYTEY